MRLPQVSAAALSVYRRYEGDPDSFARIGRPFEKASISDQVWTLIQEIEQRMRLVRLGKASDAFKSATEAEINEVAQNEEVARLLKRGA